MVELDLVGLQMPESPELQSEKQVVLKPLERGYGHTLGNTLRRILLSSLRGSAVWAFRTDGVLHEHQTMPGVVEDVHEIIKNLKGLVLEMEDDADDAVLELRTSKAGIVTAGEIRDNPNVRVVNPDHALFELAEDRDVVMELYVNKGRGFVLAEQHAIPRGAPADLVRIDAIYNPVRRANFVVEETRVGQRTDFDRLVLEVETNGSVDAMAAVQYAARLAIEHFGYLAGGTVQWGGDRPWTETNGGPAGAKDGKEMVPAEVRELLSTPIELVEEISVRSRNSLQKGNIQTVRDLVERTEQDMLEIGNFGRKSLDEVLEFLERHNLSLGMDLEETEGGILWWGGEDSEADDRDAGSDDGTEEQAKED